MESILAYEKQRNIQFAILFLIWLLIGMIATPLALVFIPISWIYLANKKMYIELFLGFFLILILSDNRHYILSFTKSLKVVYMSFMILLLFLDAKLRPKARDYLPFAPFLIIAFICILFSPIKFESFQKTLSYGMLLIIVPSFVSLLYQEYGDLFLRSLVYVGITVYSAGIILRMVNPSFVILINRYSGILGNPNGIGIFSVLFFITFQVIKTYKPHLFNKKEDILTYFVVFLSVLLAGSRGAIVSITLYFVFKRLSKVSNILSLFALMVVAFSYQYIEQAVPYIIKLFGLGHYFRLKTLDSASGRFVAYAFAWHHIQQNFWIGHGFSFTDYLFKEYQLVLNTMGHEGNAHNSYLTAWLDTGFFGLISFLAAWFYYFKRAAKNSYLAYPVMFAILFSSFFESWLMGSLNPFTIQLLILLALLTDKQFVNGSDPAPST